MQLKASILSFVWISWGIKAFTYRHSCVNVQEIEECLQPFLYSPWTHNMHKRYLSNHMKQPSTTLNSITTKPQQPSTHSRVWGSCAQIQTTVGPDADGSESVEPLRSLILNFFISTPWVTYVKGWRFCSEHTAQQQQASTVALPVNAISLYAHMVYVRVGFRRNTDTHTHMISLPAKPDDRPIQDSLVQCSCSTDRERTAKQFLVLI